MACLAKNFQKKKLKKKDHLPLADGFPANPSATWKRFHIPFFLDNTPEMVKCQTPILAQPAIWVSVETVASTKSPPIRTLDPPLSTY